MYKARLYDGLREGCADFLEEPAHVIAHLPKTYHMMIYLQKAYLVMIYLH